MRLSRALLLLGIGFLVLALIPVATFMLVIADDGPAYQVNYNLCDKYAVQFLQQSLVTSLPGISIGGGSHLNNDLDDPSGDWGGRTTVTIQKIQTYELTINGLYRGTIWEKRHTVTLQRPC